jgi:hypothetical protein
LCLILSSIFSCGSKEIYEGIYRVEADKSQKNSEVQIELREKGIGVWRVQDDEVTFRWDVKDSKIWFSTKSGGIIIGEIREGVIEIALPGSENMYFKKSNLGRQFHLPTSERNQNKPDFATSKNPLYKIHLG